MERSTAAEPASGKVDLWADWRNVGEEFTRFHQLEESDQKKVLDGETVVSPVTIKDDLLTGSVFRYVPRVTPKTLAGVFSNYDGHQRFVPGMPETRVLHQHDDVSRVFHRINPVTFIAPNAQKNWPGWIYNNMTYSYEVDEQVYRQDDDSLSVRWTIPEEKRTMGARENGEITFTRMGQGTLISYNNATEPFGYHSLKQLLPEQTLQNGYGKLGSIAADYYRRTVDGFVDLVHTMNVHDLRSDITRMKV